MIALLNKNEENVKEIFKVISTKYDLIDSIVIMGVVIIAELANERIELLQNSLLDKKSHDESM